MKYRVVYTAQALDDLDAVYAYIAFQLLEPTVAAEHYKDVASAVRSLCELPLRFPLVDAEPWNGRGLRKMPVRNYLVFYTVDKERAQVTVIRILYKARDTGKLLPPVE